MSSAFAVPLNGTDVPSANWKLWTGRALSSLAGLFLPFDSTIKLFDLGVVRDAFTRMGYPASLAQEIGVLEMACLLLYLLPRTSILGAIALTGFLGGAIALHVRIGDPWLSHTLFPSYIGAMLWLGLYLRDRRLGVLFNQPNRS